MNRAKPRLSVLVLAGGRATRMGGEKASLPVGGVPLVERVLELARAVSDDVVLLPGDRDLDAAGVTRVADAPEPDGPLGALVSGLEAVRHDWCLLLPCDLPFADAEVVEGLRQRAAATAADAVVLQDASGLQPFHGLYRTHPTRSALTDWVAGGGRSLRGLLERLNVEAVPAAEDAPSLLDVDTPADLQRARSWNPS